MSKHFSGKRAAILVHSFCYHCKLIVNFEKGLWPKYQCILFFIVTFYYEDGVNRPNAIIIPAMLLEAALNNLDNIEVTKGHQKQNGRYLMTLIDQL